MVWCEPPRGTVGEERVLLAVEAERLRIEDGSLLVVATLECLVALRADDHTGPRAGEHAAPIGPRPGEFDPSLGPTSFFLNSTRAAWRPSGVCSACFCVSLAAALCSLSC